MIVVAIVLFAIFALIDVVITVVGSRADRVEEEMRNGNDRRTEASAGDSTEIME